MTGDSDVLSLIAEATRSHAEEPKIIDRPMEALPAEIGDLRHLERADYYTLRTEVTAARDRQPSRTRAS